MVGYHDTPQLRTSQRSRSGGPLVWRWPSPLLGISSVVQHDDGACQAPLRQGECAGEARLRRPLALSSTSLSVPPYPVSTWPAVIAKGQLDLV
jgi:hypothetical protein